MLRPLHGVVHQGAVVFHGAVAGEKLGCVGRPGVIGAQEILAEIPSTYLHPDRPCPATTLYRSVMVRGVVEPVPDPVDALNALMARFQPQGGHRPVTAQDARSVRVLQIKGPAICKASTFSQRPAAQQAAIARGLWATGDVDALITLGVSFPGPADTTLFLPDPTWRTRAATLLTDQYWNTHVTPAQVAAAQRGPWVGALRDGELVGTARALSDHSKLAYVMDVAVSPAAQGLGIGRALLQRLLDHPHVRTCARVALRTRDAGPFYERLGFTPATRGFQDWVLARTPAGG